MNPDYGLSIMDYIQFYIFTLLCVSIVYGPYILYTHYVIKSLESKIAKIAFAYFAGAIGAGFIFAIPISGAFLASCMEFFLKLFKGFAA